MTSAATLSIEEKLVLAQLVYVHGDADWTTITSTWMTHHAVKNKDVNDPQMIHATWEEVVMTAAPRLGLADAASMNAPMAKGSPVAMQFARLFFQDRLYELRDAILAKETEFKTTLEEIGGFKTVKTEEQPITPAPLPTRPPLPSTSSSSLSPPPDSSPQPSQVPQVATVPPTPVTEDLTPVQSKEEAEDGTNDAMEIDGSRQATPTQPSYQVETRPTKPKEESEVEELVNFPSAPGSEAGDQEMNDATVTKEDEMEKGDVDESVQDKEGEEEDAPVSARLRRSKKDSAPKEKVETENISPKTRKGHKKGAPSQASPVSPRVTRGRRGTDAQRTATPVTATADEADGEGEQAEVKSEGVQGIAEDDASVAESNQQTDTKSTRTTRASKRKAAEMDQDSPVESVRPKRKGSEKAATAEQEEPPQTPVTATPSKQFIKTMSAVVDQLHSSEYSDPFKRAVTLKDAPDYDEVVKKPTDLSSIGKKVKGGTIRSWEELERELWLMIANCYVYNRPGSEVLDAANSMMSLIKDALKGAREK